MKVPYAGRIYDNEEKDNAKMAIDEFWLTNGRWTTAFEKAICDYIGVKYCMFVNSGSSANLLAFMTLTDKSLGKYRIEQGDEVITVAAGFPTTIAPIVQYGAIPVFVDITIPEYNIDVTQLDEALTNKTKAVMIAHTLGNPFNVKKVKQFCMKNNLWLIEDNCDALGAEYYLGLDYKTGSFGDIATSSFYPPHHITTGEGGAIYTDNPQLYTIARSLCNWGKDCVCEPGNDNACGKRFSYQYGNMPFGYDHKYIYSRLGYNLKATDIQAAIGVAQMKKLPKFVKARQDNWLTLKHELRDIDAILPCHSTMATPSWFGFAITTPDRNLLVQHLEANGIATRTLFAGNITKQPCMNDVKYVMIGTLPNTDIVMHQTFWIGVYSGITEEMMKYVIKTVHSFYD